MISKNSNYCEIIRQIIIPYVNEPQRKSEGRDMWQRAMVPEEGESEDCKIQGPIGHLISSCMILAWKLIVNSIFPV